MTSTTRTPPARQPRTRTRRAAVVGGLTALAWFAGTGVAGAETVVSVAIDNPIEGILPDFSLWGTGVGDSWRRLMGAFWAACLAVCSIWVIAAGAKFGMANKRGFAGQQVEAKQSLIDAAMGLGACAGASIIIGGVLFAVGG